MKLRRSSPRYEPDPRTVEALLADIDRDTTFERAWACFTEFGVSERHFNELESRYRALASTWVLATFVGIGFILTRGELQLPFDRLVAAAAVGFAGSAGIVLLWVMDLLVYHQLLGVVFMQGLALEKRYRWLPQMRTMMVASQGNHGVTPRIVWFYIGSSGVLLAAAGTALAFYLDRYGAAAVVGCALGFGLAIVLLGAVMFWTTIRAGEAARLTHAQAER
jgi:hypothetical protein